MGYFKVTSKKNINELNEGDIINESDYATLTSQDNFIQCKYYEEDLEVKKNDVKAGVWSIQKTMQGLRLAETSFNQDHILKEFIYTDKVTGQLNTFFSKTDIYKKYGIDVPKRGWLLYGPPGSGKSTIISSTVETYKDREDTAIIVWDTSKYEAYEIKDFVKSFNYIGVEKLILIVEDIGGIEMDQVRIKSDSSLLSLLDNVEKTFTIATAIIATTNHPEVFLGNLTNRPQRFDTKIEVPKPNGEQRFQLLEFFYKQTLPEDVAKEIKLNKYKDVTPAHLKELIIRAELDDISLLESLKKIQGEIDVYSKAFQEKKEFGL